MASYQGLSDREIVHMLYAHRARSPLVDELCRRIEDNPDNYREADTEFSKLFGCPVCSASLYVSCTVEDNGEVSWEIT